MQTLPAAIPYAAGIQIRYRPLSANIANMYKQLS